MVFNSKKLAEQIIIDDDRVDLSRASYSPELSSTDMDQDSLSFHVTMDRVAFKKPLEIVTKVLDAHGYAINLENILSCLDQLTFGTKVKLPERSADEARPLAKGFLPCVQFQMPIKNKLGPLLKLFYAEIENYEQEIARLQDGDLKKDGDKAKTREQLKKDIERLAADNHKLQLKINELTVQLSEALRSQANASRALASQNIIPPQLRLATVREILFQDRALMLKSGRTTISLPMILIDALPKAGDPCLVQVIDGTAMGAFFYESRPQPFNRELAEVLFVSAEICKVRDSQRQSHCLQAKNEAERQIFATLKRGSKILLYTIEGMIIRFERLRPAPQAQFSEAVQEQITLFQLEKSLLAQQEQPSTRIDADRED